LRVKLLRYICPQDEAGAVAEPSAAVAVAAGEAAAGRPAALPTGAEGPAPPAAAAAGAAAAEEEDDVDDL